MTAQEIVAKIAEKRAAVRALYVGRALHFEYAGQSFSIDHGAFGRVTLGKALLDEMRRQLDKDIAKLTEALIDVVSNTA